MHGNQSIEKIKRSTKPPKSNEYQPKDKKRIKERDFSKERERKRSYNEAED